GLVGKNLMTHFGMSVWAEFDEEIRWYKGPPSLAITEHWNYTDTGKDSPGGYAVMSQGPLPMAFAQAVVGGRGLWGLALRDQMAKYNHMAGFTPVGETEPRPENRVELVDDQTDAFGLPIPRVVFSYSESDRALQRH